MLPTSCRTQIAVINDEEEKATILNAKRGFIEATPTPILYEVFLHRLGKGDINREAISGYLAEVRNMGFRLTCRECGAPAAKNMRTGEVLCKASKDPCDKADAIYSIAPILIIRPYGKFFTGSHKGSSLTQSPLMRLVQVTREATNGDIVLETNLHGELG